jgi:outer membrane protein OmpA-like peptidoglycan-associated protein
VFFVSIYSNIVILGTSVLFAGDLLPMHGRTAGSPAPPVLQAALPAKRNLSVVPSESLFSQQQASGLNPSKASGTAPAEASVAISDPPFLRHPIQFGPNSLELTVAGRNMLKRAAAWLRLHREARILIVGSCDSGGSETCTRTLAEARGAVVRKFLGSSGIDSDQIVGVKAWDNVDQSCQTSDIECQQFNRSARIFMASSVAP